MPARSDGQAGDVKLLQSVILRLGKISENKDDNDPE